MQQTNIINIITHKYEPQRKYRLGTVSKEITGGGGGLKPVLRLPNLALSFYYGSKHTVVRSAWRFSNSSMDHHVKQINYRLKPTNNSYSCYKVQYEHLTLWQPL